MHRPAKLRGVQFISYADLARDIASWASVLPSDICAVVGVPRSGLTVAHMLAAELNLPAMQIHGKEFRQNTGRALSRRPGRFLVVDDTASFGTAMQEARLQVAGTPAYFGVVYARPVARKSLNFWHGLHAEPDWLVVTQWNIHAHQDSRWILFQDRAIPRLFAPVGGTVNGDAQSLVRCYESKPNAALLVTRSDADAMAVAAATGRATLSTERWQAYCTNWPTQAERPRVADGSTVTIIGKGPSAAHAKQWVEGDVCTVNESGLVLSADTPITYCFFCHARMAERARPLWDRTQTFVTPSDLLGVNKELPAGFPRHKLVHYEGNQCEPSREAMLDRINSGQPAHHHTVCAAMSWLAKQGYRRLRLIGFDGGTSYAPAFSGKPEPIGAMCRVAEDTLAALLHDLYGVTTERFDE